MTTYIGLPDSSVDSVALGSEGADVPAYLELQCVHVTYYLAVNKLDSIGDIGIHISFLIEQHFKGTQLQMYLQMNQKAPSGTNSV